MAFFIETGVENFLHFVFEFVRDFDRWWRVLGACREWVRGVGFEERNMEYVVNSFEFEW